MWYHNMTNLLLTLVFIGLPTCATSSEYGFHNFEQWLTLSYNEENARFTVNELNVAFSISNRLILKATKQSDVKTQVAKNAAVNTVWLAYSGADFDYFIAELDTYQNLFSVANELNQLGDVILVQPDLLQHRSKHSDKDLLATIMSIPNKPKRSVGKISPNTGGQGVTVAIIDDGIDLTHPALSHTNVAFSIDVTNKVFDASPKSNTDTHGTKVAGIIFAANTNQVQGLAPKASLVAIRQPDSWTSNTLVAFQIASLMKSDVINCSWTSLTLLEPVADVITDLAKHGRGGKGTAVLIAAGNQGRAITPNASEAAINEAIVVGGVQKHNKARLELSNFGSTVDLWVPANTQQTTVPTGEFGTFSLTSLATAKASGLAARILAREPALTKVELERAMQHYLKNNNDITHNGRL